MKGVCLNVLSEGVRNLKCVLSPRNVLAKCNERLNKHSNPSCPFSHKHTKYPEDAVLVLKNCSPSCDNGGGSGSLVVALVCCYFP